MEYYEYRKLRDWANSHYTSSKKEHILACEAFASIPITNHEIDLTFDELGEILDLLPKKIADQINHLYIMETDNYMKEHSKEYDKKTKAITAAFNKLDNLGMKIDFIRSGEGHAHDYEEAKRQLFEMVRYNNPSNNYSHSFFNPSEEDKKNDSEFEYYPSYDVRKYIDIKESYETSKKFNIVSKINELTKIEKEININDKIINLIAGINLYGNKADALKKTLSTLKKISEQLSKDNIKLEQKRDSKIKEIDEAIEKSKKDELKKQEQTDSRKKDSKESKSEESAVIFTSSIEKKQPMSEFERKEKIYQLRGKLEELKTKQSNLVSKEKFYGAGPVLEDKIPTEQVTEYEVINDRELYNQLDSQIKQLEKEIKALEEAPLREQEEHERKIREEIESKNKAWQDANERYQNMSLFRKMVTSLKGKNPTQLNKHNKNDLSVDEVRGLYK